MIDPRPRRAALCGALMLLLVSACKAPPPEAPTLPVPPEAPGAKADPELPAPPHPPEAPEAKRPMTPPATPAPPQPKEPPQVTAPGDSQGVPGCQAIAGVVPRAPAAPSPGAEGLWKVYGAAIGALVEEQGWERLVLGAQTVGMVQAVPAERVRQYAPALREDTLVAFARPAPRAALKNAFGLSVPVVLFGDVDWRTLFGTRCALPDAWDRFHHLYPNAGGVTYLGNIGLSEDRTQALAYLTWTSGPGKSTGRLAFLTREAGSWRLGSWVPLW